MVMLSKAVETPTRVIKRGACKTISGKSEITYQLGVDPDDRLVLRIHSNDGGGFWDSSWIPVAAILEALQNWNPDKPITSVALTGITKGRSVNTSGFLIAALRSEGVLTAIEKKQRCHELGDIEGFLAQAKALQSGNAPSKTVTAKKSPAAKASPAKGRKKSA